MIANPLKKFQSGLLKSAGLKSGFNIPQIPADYNNSMSFQHVMHL